MMAREILIVLCCLLVQITLGTFFYLHFIFLNFRFSFWNERYLFWIKIGVMNTTEQTILTNFYVSLTNQGSLNWNIATDLCGQNKIVCDSSTPQRVTQLYLIFFFFLWFFFLILKHQNRNLAGSGLAGTISTEIGLLTNMQLLYEPNNLWTSLFHFRSLFSCFLFLKIKKSIRWFDNNQFVGTIPSELGRLTSVQRL